MGETERQADGAGTEPGYTAVVYFHGIGNQRRFEETSRLVDALDRYAYQNEPRVGRLVQAVGRTEPSRIEGGHDVSYIRLGHHHRGEGGTFVEDEYRFYETYWAPVTAGTTTARSVVGWAFRQVVNPIRPLLGAWRSRPRLHRTYLYRVHARLPRDDRTYRTALKPLMTAYDDFENPEQLRRFRKGTFTEFRAFLASESATNRPEVLDLAEAWRRHFTRAILANQFVLATLAVAITVGGIAVVAGVLLLLGLLADAELARGIEGAGELVEPSLANAMILSATILGALGITRFTTRYLGDVVAWATYEETDAKHRVRSAILSEGVAQLRHVLADPRCRRVVVVGHSLGTTVAYDALLGLGQRALARSGDRGVQEEIAKLDQFVTLASPVDTVHSMFESHVAKHHRYSRVFEGLRGDVGGPPFSRRRRPQVHWVNVWDRADIISGPLFSPNQKRASAMPVDNVEVRSLSFPDPASSHVAYFAHRDVITLIFRIVFDGAYSFRGKNPSGQRVETPLPARRFLSWQLVMVAIPWLAAAYGVARITGANTWTSGILGWSALGLLVAAFVGFTYGRTRGHRAPL